MSAAVAFKFKSDSVQRNSSSKFSPLSYSGLEVSEYMELLKDEVVLAPENRAELSKHMITKLEHIKVKRGVQHEYVLATVKYNDTEFRLRIERLQGAKLPKDYQPKKSNMKISSTRLPYPSPDSLLKPTWARDMVRRMEHRPSLQRSRVLVNFSPRPGVLDLLQLAAITETVHDLEERYALGSAQCYWFAMLIMGAAMTRGGHVRYSEQGGEVVKARVVEGAVGKYLGKCGWVPIVAVKFEQIQIIAVEAKRRYDDALAVWDTVYASLNRIKQLEEEGKKIDEEFRKKVEEKVEELRKKDEELKKKDEALREKDELIRQLLSEPQVELLHTSYVDYRHDLANMSSSCLLYGHR